MRDIKGKQQSLEIVEQCKLLQAASDIQSSFFINSWWGNYQAKYGDDSLGSRVYAMVDFAVSCEWSSLRSTK